MPSCKMYLSWLFVNGPLLYQVHQYDRTTIGTTSAATIAVAATLRASAMSPMKGARAGAGAGAHAAAVLQGQAKYRELLEAANNAQANFRDEMDGLDQVGGWWWANGERLVVG